MKHKPEDIILLAHGGGGTGTRAIIDGIILKALGNPILNRLDDSACLTLPELDIVFTTDSYVVNPIFFPGGDIGKLAACGTINDLAMQGAEPKYLSLGLILEEGLPIRDLERIVKSIAEVVKALGVQVVTGDTKVVERGKGSGIFINTSGIGARLPGVDVHVSNARPGDAVILSGTIGDHGMAIMIQRGGLKLESELCSDVAPLWPMTKSLLAAVPGVHCLRDPTRGGLAAALNDIARAANVGIRIKEAELPVRKEVRAACDLLGLDVLNVANEGKAVVVCPKDPMDRQDDIDRALKALRSDPLGREARLIGTVEAEPRGMVLLETIMGGERIIEDPGGEDLPRIC